MSGGGGVRARLREREEARRAAQEQRRRERERESREEETAGHFSREFSAKKFAIEALLSSTAEQPQDGLSALFDKMASECQALQKFVSDSSLFLASYDLRNSQQQLSELLQAVRRRQDELQPKPRFAFKSRRKEATQPLPPPPPASSSCDGVRVGEEAELGGGDGVRAVGRKVGSEGGVAVSCVGFSERTNEKLSLRAEEVGGHDVNLSQLRGCEVRLSGSPSTLHMSDLQECTVLSGPVASSIFVEGCSRCTFVVAGQQLRVHSSRHSSFYLHVSSRAIIEDCSLVTFAPYNWDYPELGAHFELAGLDRGGNHWDHVDDFNWLASGDPSPNWRVLPEEERTPSW